MMRHRRAQNEQQRKHGQVVYGDLVCYWPHHFVGYRYICQKVPLKEYVNLRCS